MNRKIVYSGGQPEPKWMPLSEMKVIDRDISWFGYNEEFVTANDLRSKKHFHCAWEDKTNFFEPMEVSAVDGGVLCREIDEFKRITPEVFETQFGRFNNHNNGEFASWLGRDGYNGIPDDRMKMLRDYGINEFYIEGNYCEMFDCGEYSYAVSNLMHMALGYFKVARIDNELKTEVLFDNDDIRGDGRKCFEYIGCFENKEGVGILLSGDIGFGTESEVLRTLLLQVDRFGGCSVKKEWGIRLSEAFSFIAADGLAYIGQNKMVTRLDLTTGETVFYTNKSDDELAALSAR